MYEEFTLSNGLRVVAEKIPHFRSVSVGLWIGAGSMYETAEENGLSHFIEHMLFKGTQRRSAKQIAQEMDAIGGQMNAFTAKECTCYYAKVIDEHFEKALDLLSDLVLGATFDEAEFEKERGVILEEIAMVEDTPEDLVYELLAQAIFGDQSLARPILGPAQQIRTVSRDTLVQFRNRHYRPDNTVLAVAGNYDWTQLKELAEKMLGAWGSDQAPSSLPAPAIAQPGRLVREKDIEQVHVCLGYPGVAQGSEDLYPLSVLNNLFGGGMSSRLFQRIREEMGAVYSVYSYPTTYPGCGTLTLYAGTSPEQAQKVIDEIHAQTQLLLRDGITKEEFEQSRDQLKGSYILGLESTSSRMSSIGRSRLLLENLQTPEETIAKIEAVRMEDVMRVANDVFQKPYAASAVGKNAGALQF